jgi:hypothetical protein
MFSATDLQQLAARGISEAEAARQLELLRHAPPPTRLDRPCAIGDGIVQIKPGDHSRLLDAARRAADDGRLTKFVPASGAATRMFKDLIAARDAAAPVATFEAARQFFAELDRFPFATELRQRAAMNGAPADDEEQRRVLRTLLDEMRYAALPKALIAFHRVNGSVRTAFEEHLLEGTAYTRDAAGTARTHFTVAPEFRDDFETLLEQVRTRIEQSTGARIDVSFSEQHPSTDTLAATPDGALFRAADGSLLMRPAGHGALLRNLQSLTTDLVVIKNIDNVQPIEASRDVIRWKQLLIGYLVTLLDEGPDDRPVRVCGVVRNEGEPGGAPFWVVDGHGAKTAQIVESSQVNLEDTEQRRIFESSTHFNPVDLVCAIRRLDGHPFDLAQFVDASAVFRSSKSHEGHELVALERPGLWNGAMAHWRTVFVEVPASTFAPVKTVFDLLRPQHQWGAVHDTR